MDSEGRKGREGKGKGVVSHLDLRSMSVGLNQILGDSIFLINDGPRLIGLSGALAWLTCVLRRTPQQ